jgi:hypothetical protein
VNHPDLSSIEGSTLSTVMLSPCVGGVLRIWKDDGSSKLTGVVESDYLNRIQGTGMLSRTLREEGRFREVGLLSEDGSTLSVMSRFPREAEDGTLHFDGSLLALEPPAAPDQSLYEDLRALLDRAIRYTVESNGLLVVELGGWDAPTEPYCLYCAPTEHGTRLSVIEAAPAPRDSEVWAPQIGPGDAGATLRAPLSEETLEVAALIMMEAIDTWRVAPWDLALTFGTFPGAES